MAELELVFSRLDARRRLSRAELFDPRRRTPNGELKMPKFVQFHIMDGCEELDEIFWEDPRTFTPRRGRNGYVEAWGLFYTFTSMREVKGERYRDDEDFEIIRNAGRRTNVNAMVYSADSGLKLPEKQFLDFHMEQKISSLRTLDLGTLRRSDYLLYLSLPYIAKPGDSGADRYWRRVRISGGLPLGVFADKIISPLFGWVRNCHVHLFHCYKDGALFGPKDCNAPDMAHLGAAGRAYIPEESYTISHLLQKPGDVMGYHYDLGDNWWVDIKLEEVIPAAESTNRFELISGAGGMLPDGHLLGNRNWADLLDAADRSFRGKLTAVKRLYDATNYAGKARPALTTEFSFDRFDFAETRAAVRAALDSKASLARGSKTVVHPLNNAKARDLRRPENAALRLGINPRELKKGTRVERTAVNGKGAFLEEGVANRRVDSPKTTACAWCGSPHDLKICTGCRQRYYCTKACHSAHGRSGHRLVCA